MSAGPVMVLFVLVVLIVFVVMAFASLFRSLSRGKGRR